MSQYLEKMKLGDRIDVKGPLGHFVYEGKGVFKHSGKRGAVKQMSMIAGGTGITPMFQIIKVCASYRCLLQAEDPVLIQANQAYAAVVCSSIERSAWGDPLCILPQ